MRAIGVNEFGGPDVLEMLDVPIPEPGPGEVRVRVELAGINFIDVYMRAGDYRKSDTYKTPLPMVLGMEGAGVVDALGDSVDGPAPGQRVAWCIHRGAYAEYAVVPAWKLVGVPDNMPLDVACALQLQGCTAHYLTHSAAPLGPRDTCLAHAGAGGVGQLLIQLAKHRGATVITTVGSPDKAELARAAGADHVILYRDTDFLEAVREITEGQGVDVVYDAVGRDTIDRSIRCLRQRGTIVNYGGSVFFTRPHLADYMASAGEIRGRTDTLFELWADGKLKVALDRTLPLEDAAEAHRLIQGRETRGKLLLSV